MKKILLIITLTFFIFQLVTLAVDIDIGNPAMDYTSDSSGYVTYVDKINPANASGKITSVEIYANADMAGVQVATFYVVSGNYLSTRDTHTIGNVTAGSKQTFSELDITVETGDYIGLYWSTGQLEINEDDFNVGIWYLNGDNIPCTNIDFGSPYTWYMISLYGTGATIGWTHKWNTITIAKWNTKEFIKWNGLE